MPYGEIRVDTITFTNAGVDKSITVSGLFASTSGNLTVTGTVSGTTFTGTTANFTSGNVTTFSGGTCTITSGVFASGTATNPSISFIADSNTGFYSPGADQVAIATSGTGRLLVDSFGRVGIGFTSPGALLDVFGSGNIARFGDGTNTFDVRFKGPNNWAVQLDTSSDKFNIQRNSSSLVTVDSSGRLGIGTTSPLTKLEVRSGVITAGSVDAPNGAEILRGYYGSDGALAVIGSEYSSGGPVIGCGVKPSTSVSDAFLSSTSTALSRGAYTIQGNIHKWFAGASQTVTENSSVSTSEVMRIDSAGRVGIGTSSPNYKLDVSGGGLTPGHFSSTVDWNFSNLILRRNASNVSTAKMLSMMLQGDTDSDTTLTNYLNIWGTYSAAPTTGSTTAGLSGVMNLGAPSSIALHVNGSQRLLIDSSGRVGIGTSSPIGKLDVTGTNIPLIIQSTVAASNYITHKHITSGDIAYMGNGGGGALTAGTTSDYAIRANLGSLIFACNGDNERARIDSAGRLLVGTSTARSNVDFQFGLDSPRQQLEIANAGTGTLVVSNYDNGTNGAPAYVTLARAGSTAIGSTAIVANNNWLGEIDFSGSDGTDFTRAASIRCEVDGTPGTNDMPGRLVFSTTADGASTPTERMRISQNGVVGIGTTDSGGSVANGIGAQIHPVGYAQFIRSNATLLVLNRRAGDGNLVEFYQDDTQEGTISVSGTTVSYNGAHLSRYSQFPGGIERTEILRGTVLSNIDEMCAWGEEANEQLNRMKVSDVEGDPNVAGVFQGWDDDDDTYTDDFYCAMTGDFIIRITQGVTVQRGNLLMSAGDGTAKPQGDDIVRSKTVAKVTSTHITCTYDDGSYCVPCVLMAC